MRTQPALPATLGMLCALAVILQLGPVWWPGFGLVLAMAAPLPVALAAAVHPARCAWFYLGTALLLGMVVQEEMFVFVTLTGPLGLMLGLFAGRRRAWLAVLTGAVLLTGGMLLLPSLAGVYPLGGWEAGWPWWLLAVLYAGVAVAYAAAWSLFFQRIWVRMDPILRYTGRDAP